MNQSKKVLVFGSTGFVGKGLIEDLKRHHVVILASLRGMSLETIDFSRIDVVVFLIGQVPTKNVESPGIYFDINRDLTYQVAKKSKKEGVEHFIYLSSTKVYGEKNDYFNETSKCNPPDFYGKSKYEAELKLLDLSLKGQMKVSIIRSPIIYGAGVKGNLKLMMNLIEKVPVLPFKNINNKRSMVYLGNLNALFLSVIEKRIDGIFIAGDKNGYSTSELVDQIALNLDRRIWLFKMPKYLLTLLQYIKPELYYSLFNSLIIDNKRSNEILNFSPPYTFEQGIKEMTNYFLLKEHND